VAREVGDQLAAGSSDIFGVMLESHLVEGRQDLVEGEASMYGQSVTDACISWEATETVLAELAEAVERGRGV
jgi:3-deoxy-7-phosphoheptulonate synthase